MKISKQDWGFVPVDPDPGFDPEHNKRVIQETLAENAKIKARRMRESDEGVGERSQALAQYLDDVNKGRTESGVVDYFGRHEIARLRGEEISKIIRGKIGDVTKRKIQEQAKIHTVKS